MAIKNKIIVFTAMVAICLAAQSYDKYIGKFSNSSINPIDLLVD